MYPPTTPSLSLKVALTSFSIILMLGSTICMVSFTTSLAYFSSQTTFASSGGSPYSRLWVSPSPYLFPHLSAAEDFLWLAD